MKNYVGVRIVKAEPEEHNGKDGYRVIYPNGKSDWIPKAAFETQFREFENSVNE